MNMEKPAMPESIETRIAKTKEFLATRHRQLAAAYEGTSGMDRQDMIDGEHDIRLMVKVLEELEKGA